MSCKRCPHHVRHGQVAKDGQDFQFKNLCGLKLKQNQDPELIKKTRGRGRPAAEPVRRKPPSADKSIDCTNYPFSSEFDYFFCNVYQETFASKGLKNDVVPTKDFEFSENFTGVSVTDMELL
ncbi:MAG: hypothetical protein KA436_01080 [Oligoflexales bacterium]|nr:hypothetical protein [Oligoflexales bacterium]